MNAELMRRRTEIMERKLKNRDWLEKTKKAFKKQETTDKKRGKFTNGEGFSIVKAFTKRNSTLISRVPFLASVKKSTKIL